MSVLVIAKKEFKDYLSSRQFWAIYLIFNLLILASAYQGAYDYKENVRKYEEELRRVEEMKSMDGEVPPALLRIMVPKPNVLISFTRMTSYIALIGALLAIIIGFNAISGEKDKGTLTILLSYPTFRDKIINGKFLGRVAILILACTFTLIAGIGITIGLTNAQITYEEITRIVAFILVSSLYLSSFLVISIFLSIIFKENISSLVTCIILWVSSVFLLMPISKLIAIILYPLPKAIVWSNLSEVEKHAIEEATRNHFTLIDMISRVSPSYNYQKLGQFILNPYAGEMSFKFMSAPETSPLPLSESLALSWSSLAVLLGLTIFVFVASYLLFMRQDVR